jgi:EAL domain-containing protein (putative c-di-GMP-specific phosphodiesterase class I)
MGGAHCHALRWQVWQGRGPGPAGQREHRGAQLQDSSFVGRLRERLLAHPAVDPARLELEVLETSALEDMVRQVGRHAHGLQPAGHHVCAGRLWYRLFVAHLSQAPAAQVLKIDQSFVRDMLDDPDDLAILEGVLGLARAFSARPWPKAWKPSNTA